MQVLSSKCLMNGCKSDRKRPEYGTEFYLLPVQNKKTREIWAHATGNPEVTAQLQRFLQLGKEMKKGYNNFRICSLHFKEKSYRKNTKRKTLNPSALPEINLPPGVKLTLRPLNFKSRRVKVDENPSENKDRQKRVAEINMEWEQLLSGDEIEPKIGECTPAKRFIRIESAETIILGEKTDLTSDAEVKTEPASTEMSEIHEENAKTTAANTTDVDIFDLSPPSSINVILSSPIRRPNANTVADDLAAITIFSATTPQDTSENGDLPADLEVVPSNLPNNDSDSDSLSDVPIKYDENRELGPGSSLYFLISALLKDSIKRHKDKCIYITDYVAMFKKDAATERSFVKLRGNRFGYPHSPLYNFVSHCHKLNAAFIETVNKEKPNNLELALYKNLNQIEYEQKPCSCFPLHALIKNFINRRLKYHRKSKGAKVDVIVDRAID